MAETYFVKADVRQAYRSATYPALPWMDSNYQNVLFDGSAFSIFNATGSGRLIKVHSLSLEPGAYLHGMGGTFSMPVLRVQTISALQGGTAVSAIKTDSSHSALTSSVNVVTEGHSVTLSNTVLRRQSHIGLADYEAGPTSFWPGSMNPVNTERGSGFTAGQLWRSYDGQAQSLTLREGQGVSLWLDSASATIERCMMQVTLRLRDTTNSRTYFYNFMAPASYDWPLVSVFNNSGSGVVLAVGEITATTCGPRGNPTLGSPANCIFYVRQISGAEGGEALTAAPMDTANTLLPAAGISIATGAMITAYGDDARGMTTAKLRIGDQFFRRLNNSTNGSINADGVPNQWVLYPWLSNEGPGGALFGTRSNFYYGNENIPIVLRSGEGLAIYVMNGLLVQNLSTPAYSRFAAGCEVTGIVEAVVTVESAPDGLPVGPSIMRAPAQIRRWA